MLPTCAVHARAMQIADRMGKERFASRLFSIGVQPAPPGPAIGPRIAHRRAFVRPIPSAALLAPRAHTIMIAGVGAGLAPAIGGIRVETHETAGPLFYQVLLVARSIFKAFELQVQQG